MQRRAFVASACGTLIQAQSQPRPNILWVTCEDMSPNIGCYGDRYAKTPTLDAFAERSLRYRNVWSCAPVCAPARTTIISGMYPPSTGAEHMRSQTKLAPGQKMFPQVLREQGYYTSNNSKEDYNIDHTGKVWDESSARAHWRNRAAGQPFFSVVNFVVTHESQIRATPHTLIHDPRELRLPAYHPDLPEVRHDWAQYYDKIQAMDGMVRKTLGELETDGLMENTIVFFYSDHGAGLPRSKRWPYNSGLQVPMMVHVPEKYRQLAPKDYQPGGWTDRLVSFVDLAPTVLSLTGVAKQDYHQGHAFLGPRAEEQQPYVYGFRGRMDERIDMVRSVRSKRHVYIRNYMPHRIYGQHVSYMFEMPTALRWKEAFDAGKTNEAQGHFWKTKPAEELYDLETDRDEVTNLALSPNAERRNVLNLMREAQRSLALRICDVGFLPEHEMHTRAKGDAPYTMGHDIKRFDAPRVMAAAEALAGPRLADSDSGVRYWSAISLLRQGKAGVGPAASELRLRLADPSPDVGIVAAECLARFGDAAGFQPAMDFLLKMANADNGDNYLAVSALNSLTEIGGTRLKPFRDRIKALPGDEKRSVERSRGYVPRLIEHLLEISG